MNALLYTRVSHDEQVKFGYSLEAQKQTLIDYCKANGLTVKGIYTDEGISGGSITKRKALQKMLNDADRGDIILFTKLDRFSRNLLDANIIVQDLEQKGVSIKATQEDDIDTTTADGKFIFNLKLSLAQREREKTSERIRNVFEYKKSVGEALSGSVPLGYKIKDKHLVIDDDTKDIAIRIFELFDSNNNKYATWEGVNQEYGYNRSHRSLGDMLKNEIYIGKHNGNPNYCEPLIDEALFNRVQQKLSKNIKRTPKRNQYMFSCLIVCPICGSHMFGYTNKSGKNIYHYYKCVHAVKAQHNKCPYRTSVREDRIEAELLEKLPIFARKEKERFHHNAQVPDVTDKIKSIKSKIDRTNELYIDGMIDRDTHTLKISRFKSVLHDLEKIAEARENKALDDILELDVMGMYQMLNEQNKYIFWHRFIKAINVNEDKHIDSIEFYD